MLEGPPAPRGQREMDKAAAALGVTLPPDEDDDQDERCEVWPDTLTAVLLFQRMTSQWRMGPRGPIGLDYAVLPLVAPAAGVSTQQACEALDDLRVMEQEALEWFAARRD